MKAAIPKDDRNPGIDDFILQVFRPRAPNSCQSPIFAGVENYPLPRSPEVEFSRGPRFYIWLLSESNSALLGFPCPATRNHLHPESSRPCYSSILQCSSYCGCMGCVE